MLKEAAFKPVYATGEDEPAEFFLEGLLNSTSFDLGLGYFSSSGFRALALGFAYFIKRGGKMRVIINDSLSPDDKSAIMKGLNNDPDALLEERIIADIVKLKETLSRKDKHFFNCLSWLVATHHLAIKAVRPRKNKVGIVHQKFGIFSDLLQNKVVFTGSINFSANALFNNVEAIWCDFSWMENRNPLDRIKHFENLFHKTWTGFSDVVEIVPIEKVKTVLRDEFPVSNLQELVGEELAIAEEAIVNQSLPESYVEKVAQLIDRLRPIQLKINTASDLPELRDYQREAIKNWKQNGYRGILEMATGTGKTYTALAAAIELLKERERLFLIISCPFIHLAEQWQEEARKFGLEGILVGESRFLWEEDAARQAQLFRRKKKDMVVLITTNASFSSDSFQKIIASSLEETLLVIDEAHYAGAYSIRRLLPENCKYRLGLSATPERYGDDEGTQALFDYFGSIVFSFPIEKAIGKFLTPYYYHAIPVELTEEEFEDYCQLTAQIVNLINRTADVTQERLKMLLIKRARIQNNSINKIHWLRKNILQKPLDYSLFYAGDQIFDSVKHLLGKELKIKIHEFTSRQSRAERKKLLEEFANQKIQSLLAMKCLDEGVDVPPTRSAYFLASSSNPREFVQRRGRVLRKYPGKDYAIIYDLISIPPPKFIEAGSRGKEYTAVKSAFTKEYKRVQEFAHIALNQYEAMNELFTMADQLDLLDITHK
jgi:superfamily II DNA or RNA helicase